ncbi:hypothetical protein F5Y15DRAFT_14419 [Xylariaceae sp. FL0016]|nr:hypothetical protein F5Y15DRAFT_14419 [Xylariaceae sp. FL0016]
MDTSNVHPTPTGLTVLPVPSSTTSSIPPPLSTSGIAPAVTTTVVETVTMTSVISATSFLTTASTVVVSETSAVATTLVVLETSTVPDPSTVAETSVLTLTSVLTPTLLPSSATPASDSSTIGMGTTTTGPASLPVPTTCIDPGLYNELENNYTRAHASYESAQAKATGFEAGFIVLIIVLLLLAVWKAYAAWKERKQRRARRTILQQEYEMPERSGPPFSTWGRGSRRTGGQHRAEPGLPTYGSEPTRSGSRADDKEIGMAVPE